MDPGVTDGPFLGFCACLTKGRRGHGLRERLKKAPGAKSPLKECLWPRSIRLTGLNIDGMKVGYRGEGATKKESPIVAD